MAVEAAVWYKVTCDHRLAKKEYWASMKNSDGKTCGISHAVTGGRWPDRD